MTTLLKLYLNYESSDTKLFKLLTNADTKTLPPFKLLYSVLSNLATIDSNCAENVRNFFFFVCLAYV